MRKISIILLFFLLYLNAYPEARQPIEILADSMEWNKQLGQAIATGNAKAIQGETTIKANKIIAVLSEDNSQQIKELEATGKVVFFKDKQLVTGDKATYYLNQEKVIITGNVELKRDGNIIKGEKLIIDFLTGLSKMEGSSTNQKVKMKYITE
ncbi:lipopolysaccharide transport periplasmic protein LptA [Alphaproteobacteria bacterium]|nr:lipopolysaccharide transport periplasmic protein LptA [Alphaproteobacteria bacterium]